jgi:type VI protein secretion system component Hcp
MDNNIRGVHMQSSSVLRRVTAILSFVALGLPVSANAGNLSLTLDGITTPIEILSFKVGASNVGTVVCGGGSGAGKVTYTGFAMTAPESAASPILLSGVNDGRHLRTGRLQVHSSSGLTLLSEWTFNNVAMVAFDIESGAPDPKAKGANQFLPPQTSFALEFSRVCYRIFGADGKVAQETCWDLAENKPV